MPNIPSLIKLFIPYISCLLVKNDLVLLWFDWCQILPVKAAFVGIRFAKRQK